MAKKKKKIVHLNYADCIGTLCGTKKWSYAIITIMPEMILKFIGQCPVNERYCHKCKHIHKLNLVKVK
ncbi:MAG: hypothetical protein A2499_04920 [Stygiobacter sp. RIFOXYC12_FULL_38_8]|nr:MAG: hypothetical protein A2299_16290 [Stygiobacter sp. RIFOXYB2_FULL_37_11]OGV13467.1 MAG: hypothetical protein A2237_16985 [Stygiobacter sp. RIFOXYA2_FULL_38_8]OGV14758.1 MAG: hypothetical protein A2440_09670 [Stygiobacter sp. RIFOXYC2_FULL_38_25]OGV22294.1 MAG: hypothetical protein A2499_04920 [Stygiobacter sp. RIFOXYC12_FULL_38_8]OGV79251.1 MAG: hypothetical protein A2X65_02040 [Stygiobacter sp. GWF2_38_21]